MASPIIRSVTATPSTLQPGQSSTVVIDAIDPDSRVIELHAEASDSQGNTTVHNTTTITVGDPMTYTLTCDDPTVNIVQDPTIKNKFTVQV